MDAPVPFDIHGQGGPQEEGDDDEAEGVFLADRDEAEVYGYGGEKGEAQEEGQGIEEPLRRFSHNQCFFLSHFDMEEIGFHKPKADQDGDAIEEVFVHN